MLKVLVVDDEMPIRQWLEFCMEKLDGVTLAGAACHGAEGYSLFRKTQPDVVITDIRMPVMDGLEMIQMIRNLNPSVYAVVLTSFEDFEYARKAMSLGASEYILKTEITGERLKESLERARTAIGSTGGERREDQADRNYLLRSLVLADAPVPCREAVLDEYGVRLRDGMFYAVNVYLEEGGTVHRPQTGFLQNTMRFPVDDRNVMIVGNVSHEYGSGLAMREGCREYCRAILEQTPCYIGVSDPLSGRARLSEAMFQAYRRTRRCFYQPKERIYTAGDAYCWRLENEERYKIRFSKNLIEQKVSGAMEIKDQVLEKVREEKPLDVEAVKGLFSHFMVNFLHMTRDDVDRVEEEVRQVKRAMEGARRFEDMERLVNGFFEERGFGAQAKREYSQAVRRAIAYMEEHYSGAITLTDVASHVGFSAEYFSRLFKEETGMKFIVYLNNLRLRHAIELLETTNLKVYEVAEQTGYSNLSYFSTVFKKNFGQNPFDYKNGASAGKNP